MQQKLTHEGHESSIVVILRAKGKFDSRSAS